MQPNPLDPVASERLSHADKLFTSDLSINEFALLHGAGFEPIDLVMGVSVYHVGYQFTGIKQQSGAARPDRGDLSGALECDGAHAGRGRRPGADGVVGVRLEWRHQGETASTSSSSPSAPPCATPPKPGAYRRPNGQAFSSHLSGQDMTTLLRSGFAPVAFVMGNCVFHIAVQGFMQTLKQAGRNAEMPQWTQGNYEARELAMSRMQAEAERDGANGVVGVGLRDLELRVGTCTRSSSMPQAPRCDASASGETIMPSLVLPMSG